MAEAKRKRLGVVTTDVQLFGGFDMQRMQPLPRQKIIDELEKQYEVVQVDPSKPIEKFDALLAVQPSTLAQPQLFNLIQAIRGGQPTAIFEDPSPVFEAVAGTTEPKQGGQMGMQGGPKGDIGELWSLLGIKYAAKDRGGRFAAMRTPAIRSCGKIGIRIRSCSAFAACRANSCSSGGMSLAEKPLSTTNRRSLPACRKCGFPSPERSKN